MSINRRSALRFLGLAVSGGAVTLAGSPAPAQARPSAVRGTIPAFTVDARVALHSLMSLGDAHLQKTVDVMTMLATTDAARSADWERIRGPLVEAARFNVPAVYWFALPDGTYWTPEQGRVPSNLADRPYFSRVLAGRTVMGELVVSRSSNRNTAVVAVPVRGSDSSVAGVLGSSVHLDKLSMLIREEMGGLEDRVFFYAVDAEPLGAVHSDPSMIFTEPMKLGDEGMRRAFTEMLAGREGVVTYRFQGGRRTVVYHKSPVTGWWYALGMVQR